MRWQFQLALTERARRDPRIVLLYCDVGGGLWGDFRREMPDRCINVGIAEQATVSMAAGMAMQGLRPVVYTITPFLVERAFEQIKIDVDQQNLPVGLVGVECPSAGPTHRSNDAAALIATCPNVRAYYPGSKEAVGIPENIDAPWFLSLHE